MLHRRTTALLLSLFAVLGMLLASCGGGAAPATHVTVSSKEFTEQYILGNMYTMLLQDAGYDAEYKSLAGTAEAHDALVNGDIDLYPEYTGTALLTQLGMSYDSSMSSQDVYDTVKQQYLEKFNLVWLEPTKFNNTYCLTMPKDTADSMGINTVSDLSKAADQLVFGTTQEFTEREDGLPGLQKVYGGFNFKEVRALDPGLLYSGIQSGDIDVTTCFGTDGQIAAYDLKVLQDDKNFWPPYPVAPVVRKDLLDAHPDIADTLNKVAPLLDGATMSGLNWEVAGNSREPDEVAREFLQENGLISNQ
jgi:osmoprotectant transport system substrate-binding protein